MPVHHVEMGGAGGHGPFRRIAEFSQPLIVGLHHRCRIGVVGGAVRCSGRIGELLLKQLQSVLQGGTCTQAGGTINVGVAISKSFCLTSQIIRPQRDTDLSRIGHDILSQRSTVKIISAVFG